MINWYYVQGSERVGPVGFETLKELFLKDEINSESYVWRKGFQNWERIKDVTELDFSSSEEVEVKLERRAEKAAVQIEKETPKKHSSPEIHFNFDWSNVRGEEELFFVKVGHDRKTILDTELYGPYSMDEIHSAIDDKRINNHSLVFAAGMPGWLELGDTPLDPKNLKVNSDKVLDKLHF